MGVCVENDIECILSRNLCIFVQYKVGKALRVLVCDHSVRTRDMRHNWVNMLSFICIYHWLCVYNYLHRYIYKMLQRQRRRMQMWMHCHGDWDWQGQTTDIQVAALNINIHTVIVVVTLKLISNICIYQLIYIAILNKTDTYPCYMHRNVIPT